MKDDHIKITPKPEKEQMIEIFGITPDQIRIERGKPIMYLLMHPDERPESPGWELQRRAEGCYSLWRHPHVVFR